MITLKEAIADARARHIAIGHFNIATLEMFWGVVNAARELDTPVVIGVSEGERDFVGLRQAVALVVSVRAERFPPIFLNADHTYSVEKVKEAIDAGFDSVIFDGAKLSFEENVAKTKECVMYARASGREVLVEGELGYIGKSSKVWDEIPEGASVTEELMTKPEEATRFVRETGVDLLAPAVGNFHGMLARRSPRLTEAFGEAQVGVGGLKDAPGVERVDSERVKAITEAAGVPLVLHGGSGITDEDFRAAIKAGILLVHVSTELRVAYRNALEKTLADHPGEIAPYKYLDFAHDAVHAVVLEKIKLFSGVSIEVGLQ